MDNILKTIFDETAGRKDRGIPCLIGPPQWGKTYSVMQWSEMNGRKVVRLLAQTMEPEAICGYDVRNAKGELIWAPPSWLRIIFSDPTQKWTLFLDELDKAREASQTALLTLLCDRMVQNKMLPDTVAIVAAMNVPRSPLPPALVERLLFMQFPVQNTDLTEGITTLKSIAKEYLECPNVPFPERIKNKGIAIRLESWTKFNGFWEDENLRSTVVMGLVPIKDIPWWQSKLDPKAFHGVNLATWAEKARPSDVRDSLISLLNSEKDQQKRYDVLKVLCDRANADPTSEIAKVLSDLAERMHEVV